MKAYLKKKRNFVRPVDHIRITPWKDEWEWQSVSHGITQALALIENGRVVTPPKNFDCAQLEQALGKCHIWKSRGIKLPHAIDCTYKLSSLLYQDYCSFRKSLEIQPITLQLAYATAVIRSVNGLADQLQQNRALAAPVSYLCQQLGLPGWIVDLRHESAHNELPSLPRLRLAAHTLLIFFHERYWLVVEGHREERRLHAKLLLKKYTTAALEELENKILPLVIVEEENPEEEQGKETIKLEKQTFEDEDKSWLDENFYAALCQPAKKKKKMEKKEQAENPEQKLGKLSTLEIADSFVTTIQQDMAYHVSIDYLVWNHDEDVLTTRKPQLYQTLFQRICQVWPGYASTFVTHCVEYYLLYPSRDEKVAEWVEAIILFNTTKIQTLPLRGLLKRLNKDGNESSHLVNVLKKAYQETQGQVITKIAETDWCLVEDWEACAIGSLPGHAI